MKKISLESRIEAEVFNFSGTVGVYANDFRGNTVEINPDEEFETASTIKSFILAELYRQIDKGLIDEKDIIEYTEENFVVGSGILRSLDYGVKMTVKDIATLMIIVSDNIATNMIIDLVGLDNVNKTCRDLGLNKTILHNKIDFEKYSKLGTTTPRDYGRLFEMIYKKELWSEESSNAMLEIFTKQRYDTILSKDLPQYFLDSENTGDEELFYIASKSGSMNACRNDGGIMYTPYGGYGVTVFTKDFQDSLYYSDHESYRFGARVSRLLFDQYMALEGKFK